MLTASLSGESVGMVRRRWVAVSLACTSALGVAACGSSTSKPATPRGITPRGGTARSTPTGTATTPVAPTCGKYCQTAGPEGGPKCQGGPDCAQCPATGCIEVLS